MSLAGTMKNVLLTVIKDMLKSNPEMLVPSAVEDCILEGNGCPQQRIEPNYAHGTDLPLFVKHLRNWIEETYGGSKERGSNAKAEDFAQFNEIEEKCLECGREYVNHVLTVIGVLKETISSKGTHSKMLKSKCGLHVKNAGVLMKKLNFLQYQFLHKLYVGENSMNAHVKLQENLVRDIGILKASYDRAVILNDQYNEMKKNKEFLELCRAYKELKKIETRTEIIGNL